ncbi:hypothetical protein GOBAR_AA35599 [Gossypium barbadense]|uniref:Uncharacterized protein n=1 Tax=Gossypium barbadense TaxID=3634 RepID=A0A2P5W1W7_GOSBA|nr:hypothetical protein GOBAR_AA35599 [Gossypium barbadense]
MDEQNGLLRPPAPCEYHPGLQTTTTGSTHNKGEASPCGAGGLAATPQRMPHRRAILPLPSQPRHAAAVNINCLRAPIYWLN